VDLQVDLNMDSIQMKHFASEKTKEGHIHGLQEVLLAIVIAIFVCKFVPFYHATPTMTWLR